MQISGVFGDVSVVLPFISGHRSSEVRHFHVFSDSKSLFSGGFLKNCSSFCTHKLENDINNNSRSRGLTVKASGSSSDNVGPIAPLQFESAVGQLLAQILQTHPHLISSAIDQQLENLQTDRESERDKIQGSPQDLLYKRIAEVKEKERQQALVEILYCLIVKKFIDNNILMIPKMPSTSNPTSQDDFPNQEQKLQSVHSPEVYEMIESHLSLVLEERAVGPLSSYIQMSKIKLGKLYAASIMYGYFLRRVDERFQLEQTMKTLPDNFNEDPNFQGSPIMKQLYDPDSLVRIYPDENGGGMIEPVIDQSKVYRLRSYVMYLDTETLQKYATIRSKEAISLIEKQTQALFGRPDIKVADDGSIFTANDEVMEISMSGLTMLVLEAVTFGSFLWDSENYVESKYHFVKS